MPIEISVGPPVLTINQGSTFMVTTLSGEIGTGGEQGLFATDTRFLSHYAISANGEPWRLLTSAATAHYAVRIVLGSRCGPDGWHAELWVDESYPIIEIYTADTLSPGRRLKGLGTEPMTCPPNAFRSGDGLIRLVPGQAATTTWGARLT